MSATQVFQQNYALAESSSHHKLYSELKYHVENYAGGVTALSNKVGISKATLWRWVNFKNSKAPRPYHVLSLMKFVTKKNSLVEIINSIGGEISRYLKDSFPADIDFELSTQNLDLNNFLEDPYCYFIYLLCGVEKTMTRREVKKVVGTYSLEKNNISIDDENLNEYTLVKLGQIADLKINFLIKNGILMEEKDILVRTKNIGKINVAITKKHLPSFYSFFKEKNMHKNSNFMFAYQESIPRDIVKKIIKLQYDTFVQCYQMMERHRCTDGEIYLLSTFFENFNFE